MQPLICNKSNLGPVKHWAIKSLMITTMMTASVVSNAAQEYHTIHGSICSHELGEAAGVTSRNWYGIMNDSVVAAHGVMCSIPVVVGSAGYDVVKIRAYDVSPEDVLSVSICRDNGVGTSVCESQNTAPASTWQSNYYLFWFGAITDATKGYYYVEAILPRKSTANGRSALSSIDFDDN